jgi:hypothetical protein
MKKWGLVLILVINSNLYAQRNREQNITVLFTVIQGGFSLLHTAVVPLKLGIEQGGMFQSKWDILTPIAAIDFGFGLLGGHLAGGICNGWLVPYERKIQHFLKTFTSGLFAGAIWGGATVAAWKIRTREMREKEEYGKYNSYFYASIGLNILLSSITQGIVQVITFK